RSKTSATRPGSTRWAWADGGWTDVSSIGCSDGRASGWGSPRRERAGIPARRLPDQEGSLDLHGRRLLRMLLPSKPRAGTGAGVRRSRSCPRRSRVVADVAEVRCPHPQAALGARVHERGEDSADQVRPLDRVAGPAGAEHHLDVIAQEAEVVALGL